MINRFSDGGGRPGSWRSRLPILFLIVSLAVSSFLIAPILGAPELHRGGIAYIDAQKDTVLGLTTASTTAAVLISAIPDDTGSSIANQLSEMSVWFLAILSALYLEKYLLTLLPYIVFRFLVPGMLALLGIGCATGREGCSRAAKKLAIFCALLLLILPSSIGLSRLINATYEASIEETLSTAASAGDALASSESVASDGEATDWWTSFTATVSDAVDGVIHGISNAIERLENILNRFIEAIAIMLITCCVLPILVIVAYAYLLKIVWGIDLTPARGGRSRASDETEDGQRPERRAARIDRRRA